MSDNLHIPDSYRLGGNSLLSYNEPDERDLIDDGRGLLHVWEPPISQARYIMGADPTVGITGWTRASRIDGDRRTDNAALEVFRVDAVRRLIYDRDGKPDIDPRTKQQKFKYADLQVAEYFGPIDAVEFGRVLNIVGRIYAGDAQDQCELILETVPGPGMLTLQELLRLGYGNLWHWELIGNTAAEETTQIGWRSWKTSQQLLWNRARRHLMDDRAEIQSPWLLDEYRGAVIDPNTMRARAGRGVHDDLIQAASMAFWAGHKWTYDPERTWEQVTESEIVDPQRMAPVLGEYRSVREMWADAVDAWD